MIQDWFYLSGFTFLDRRTQVVPDTVQGRKMVVVVLVYVIQDVFVFGYQYQCSPLPEKCLSFEKDVDPYSFALSCFNCVDGLC